MKGGQKNWAGPSLFSYPTRWSLLFIFRFLYGSYNIYLWYISPSKQNIVQLCTSRPQENPVTPKTSRDPVVPAIPAQLTEWLVSRSETGTESAAALINPPTTMSIMCFCLSLFFVFLSFRLSLFLKVTESAPALITTLSLGLCHRCQTYFYIGTRRLYFENN